jgi:small subunit ribosomal protein S13
MVIRILGINITEKKAIKIALTTIYGIGISTAERICKICDINPDKKAIEISDEKLQLIREVIKSENILVEGELRRLKTMNIKRLIDMKCYRGHRHKYRLPVRGQRTHSNAKTVKRTRSA